MYTFWFFFFFQYQRYHRSSIFRFILIKQHTDYKMTLFVFVFFSFPSYYISFISSGMGCCYSSLPSINLEMCKTIMNALFTEKQKHKNHKKLQYR